MPNLISKNRDIYTYVTVGNARNIPQKNYFFSSTLSTHPIPFFCLYSSLKTFFSPAWWGKNYRKLWQNSTAISLEGDDLRSTQGTISCRSLLAKSHRSSSICGTTLFWRSSLGVVQHATGDKRHLGWIWKHQPSLANCCFMPLSLFTIQYTTQASSVARMLFGCFWSHEVNMRNKKKRKNSYICKMTLHEEHVLMVTATNKYQSHTRIFPHRSYYSSYIYTNLNG